MFVKIKLTLKDNFELFKKFLNYFFLKKVHKKVIHNNQKFLPKINMKKFSVSTRQK